MDPRTADPFDAYGQAVNQRGSGAIEAARAGGIAALVRSMTTLQEDDPHPGAMRYEDGVPRVPAVALSTNASDRVTGWLAEGPVRLRLKLACCWFLCSASY